MPFMSRQVIHVLTSCLSSTSPKDKLASFPDQHHPVAGNEVVSAILSCFVIKQLMCPDFNKSLMYGAMSLWSDLDQI